LQTSVVFPKPAGAATSMVLNLKLSLIRLSRFLRITISGREGGIYSFVGRMSSGSIFVKTCEEATGCYTTQVMEYFDNLHMTIPYASSLLPSIIII
jgi:hypothetical protein